LGQRRAAAFSHRTDVTEPLSDIAIQRELGTLPGWARRGDVLTKTFTFRTFPDAIAFVTRVADAAESAQHHPDLDVRFTKITAALSTHDAGAKVTQKDVDLARAMERLATS
jgi:4a-hydroxytetrahydrobiopterin dehydratase